MEEKTITNNILTISKNLIDILMHGTIESSHENVREMFCDSLNNCLNIQNEIYNYMVSKGYYQITNVEQNKIEQAKEKYIKLS